MRARTDAHTYTHTMHYYYYYFCAWQNKVEKIFRAVIANGLVELLIFHTLKKYMLQMTLTA